MTEEDAISIIRKAAKASIKVRQAFTYDVDEGCELWGLIIPRQEFGEYDKFCEAIVTLGTDTARRLADALDGRTVNVGHEFYIAGVRFDVGTYRITKIGQTVDEHTF